MTPPFLKYKIAIWMVEMVQAMERDKAVLFVKDILIKLVLNKITKIIILTICSKNSLKLIAKNCC